MRRATFEDFLRAQAAVEEMLSRKAQQATAARRPPEQYAEQEDLAVYCVNPRDKRQTIYVRADSELIAGDREVNLRYAYYKE